MAQQQPGTTRGPVTVLRRKQVEARVNLSRSTLYALVKAGAFPAQVQLGPRAVGWVESEVDAWLTTKVESRCRRSIEE